MCDFNALSVQKLISIFIEIALGLNSDKLKNIIKKCKKHKGTKTPTTGYKAPEKSKVGVLVVAKENPSHTHVGTTIFNNFNKEYDYDWQLKETIFDIFEGKIEGGTTYDVVDMSNLISEDDTLSFVDVVNKEWVFNEKSTRTREKLAAEGITAVVVIKESPTLAAMECGMYGCSEHYSQGYGLFTRSFLGLDNYMASARFGISIETIDKPVDITRLEHVNETQTYMAKNKPLEDFADPADFENITEEELAPVKTALIEYFDNLAGMTRQFLVGNENVSSQ